MLALELSVYYLFTTLHLLCELICRYQSVRRTISQTSEVDDTLDGLISAGNVLPAVTSVIPLVQPSGTVLSPQTVITTHNTVHTGENSK